MSLSMIMDLFRAGKLSLEQAADMLLYNSELGNRATAYAILNSARRTF